MHAHARSKRMHAPPTLFREQLHRAILPRRDVLMQQLHPSLSQYQHDALNGKEDDQHKERHHNHDGRRAQLLCVLPPPLLAVVRTTQALLVVRLKLLAIAKLSDRGGVETR